MKKPHAVFDLDGTIADDRWRRHLIDWDEPDLDVRYERYGKVCGEDKLINAHLVDEQLRLNRRIIFLTSRSERYKMCTMLWLNKQFPGVQFELFMRQRADYRSSSELKLAYLRAWAKRIDITIVYEDRVDVHEALDAAGFNAILINTCGPGLDENGNSTGPAGRLWAMAETCEQRQAQYGEVWRTVPQLVKILFPNGVPQWLLTDPRWHLFELKLIKLSRFAHSELRHQDSIHDDGVFSALIENVIEEQEKQNE